MNSFNKDSIGRLATAFLERDPKLVELGERAFEIIESELKTYTLQLICTDEIKTSIALQAALLTIVNTGKRCFKGGVTVVIENDTSSLINWPNNPTLNEIVANLGAAVSNKEDSKIYAATIALGKNNMLQHWRVLANGWTAGVIPPGVTEPILVGNQGFPLGGIFGGALAVALSFLKLSKFEENIGTEAIGLSLWRPDKNWTLPEAQGPEPIVFPNKLWLLGLGHIGQAYSWVLGLFHFKNPNDLLVKLQDFDKVVLANLDSGLLSEKDSINRYKTRVISDWLEDRGIQTNIVERKYDENYHRQSTDPNLLLVGLDNLLTRKILKTEGFKLVLDVGLGIGLNFDIIRLNIFPNIGMSPAKLWGESKQIETSPALNELSKRLTGCGFTVGVASSFVGCISACMAISEILRSYHQGVKLSNHYLSIREIGSSEISFDDFYGTEAYCGQLEFV
jgi:hypothetical protein